MYKGKLVSCAYLTNAARRRDAAADVGRTFDATKLQHLLKATNEINKSFQGEEG